MVYKTYISKFNTIISGSKLNTGLNPIAELVYGHDTIVSRVLMYFDHNQVFYLYNVGGGGNIADPAANGITLNFE